MARPGSAPTSMDPRPEPRPKPSPEIDAQSDGERGTVFLVDDDEALRRAMNRLLSSCGFKVKAFASTEEFLAQLDPKEPGCLLLDMRMPGGSGLDLQSQLARNHVTLPIVFLTGHADARTRRLALAHGAVAFLQKPARELELLAALDQALSSS